MNRSLLLSLLALAFAVPAAAQDGPFVYATYLECDPAGLADVDAARTNALDPALNAHVAAGDIMAWGWIAHHTGGRWNRANYYVAPTLDALLAFNESWQDEVGRDHPEARTTNQTTCRVHEDYIWRVVATSRAPGEVARNRPPANGSTYFRCNQAGLDRADAIVRESFAPVLDGLVREGMIASWTWQAHVMGGAFTRLLVIDAATQMDVLRAIERYGERMENRAGAEFDELCPSHQDYLWNVSSSR